MDRLIDRLWRTLLSRLQTVCLHPDHAIVTIDVLAGQRPPTGVAWCRQCGAYSLVPGVWRRPEPTWKPAPAQPTQRARLLARGEVPS